MLTIPQSGRGNPAKREGEEHIDDLGERERKSREAGGRGALSTGQCKKWIGHRSAEFTTAICLNSEKK